MTDTETQEVPPDNGPPGQDNEEEVLTVPVVNANYYPEGIAALEGTVHDTPVDDPTLTSIRDNLVAQGHIHGQDAADANDEEQTRVDELHAAQEEAAASAEPTSEEDTSTEDTTEPGQVPGLPTTPETAEGATEQPDLPPATPVP